MPSFRAGLVTFMLRHRHLLRKPKPVDWNTCEGVQEFRRQVELTSPLFGKLPPGFAADPVAIGEMPAEWIAPAGAAKDKVMLYFHGGGYVSGTCRSHRPIVAKFVKNTGVPALLFGYRLAPEHPYPAALQDALAACRWLRDQGIAPARTVFMGDSGGGGLALATLLALRDRGEPLPAAAVVLSPVTDHTCAGESHRANVKICLSPEGTGLAFGKHYAGGQELTLPYISPLFGDLRGLPPLLIFAGSDEVLRDDSVRFAAKARQAGVDVTLRVGEGLFHCYPACAPLFPEATRAMDEIRAFVAAHLGP